MPICSASFSVGDMNVLQSVARQFCGLLNRLTGGFPLHGKAFEIVIRNRISRFHSGALQGGPTPRADCR
jgi:hypothetical protein